jgi:SAM-dependent methyltransferase
MPRIVAYYLADIEHGYPLSKADTAEPSRPQAIRADRQKGLGMNPRVVRVLYEALSRIGLNPSLDAANVPDAWLVEHVEGEQRLPPGRALDLGCGAGRNSLYLARQGWEVTGIDLIGLAVNKARAKAVGDAAKARFLQGDVTKLAELDLGDNYSLIVDSGCYYGLSSKQRDAFADGVTQVAAPGAMLLMTGFTKIPGTGIGISDEDLRRFPGWQLRTSAPIPMEEISRHTRIPLPLKLAWRSGRLQIRRFELVKAA